MSNKFENIFLAESKEKWNYNIQIPTDKPVLVQQNNGKTCFACWHKTSSNSGIIGLKLMCIERWREIVPEDIVAIK